MLAPSREEKRRRVPRVLADSATNAHALDCRIDFRNRGRCRTVPLTREMSEAGHDARPVIESISTRVEMLAMGRTQHRRCRRSRDAGFEDCAPGSARSHDDPVVSRALPVRIGAFRAPKNKKNKTLAGSLNGLKSADS